MNIKKLILLNIPYAVIFYFANKAAAGYLACESIGINAKFTATIGGITAISKNPLPSFEPKALLIGVIVAIAFKLFIHMRGKNAKKYRKGIEYGSARWGA